MRLTTQAREALYDALAWNDATTAVKRAELRAELRAAGVSFEALTRTLRKRDADARAVIDQHAREWLLHTGRPPEERPHWNSIRFTLREAVRQANLGLGYEATSAALDELARILDDDIAAHTAPAAEVG